MQAIPDEVRKCVGFIHYQNKKDETKLAGTGFIVAMPIEGTNKSAAYVVTAKHVIANIKQVSKDQSVYIRLNTTDGEALSVRTHASQWKEHPTDSTVDVSVLAWAPSPEQFDYLALPISMGATPESIASDGIGAGDEVFLTGLFSSHSGSKKNLPIVRTGNIALISDEKVHTSLGDIDAYLIEARSIGGLSGSPVFAYLGHLRPSKDGLQLGGENKLFVWLGVMHGHWDVDEDKADLRYDSDLPAGKRVNMGIGIVVPAEKVAEIINTHEDFIKHRQDAENEHNGDLLPTED